MSSRKGVGANVRLVRIIGTTRPELLVARQVAQQTGEAHGRRDGLVAGAAAQLDERLVGGELELAAGPGRALGIWPPRA